MGTYKRLRHREVCARGSAQLGTQASDCLPAEQRFPRDRLNVITVPDQTSGKGRMRIEASVRTLQKQRGRLMATEPSDLSSREQRLQEVLAAYFQAVAAG